MSTKSLQSMAWPLVISFTLRFLFTFVDIGYAAFLRDDNAGVAAIGLFLPIQAVYIAIWVGLSAGFTACLSAAFGHRDEARVSALKRAIMRGLAVLLPVLTALGVTLWFAIPSLGLEPALEEAFRIYATTLAIGFPVAGFWSIYPDSIVKAHQDTRSTMIAGLASTLTNVALNTLFVFAFGWGIFGIAIATVLSRFPGLIYASWRARALEAGRTRFDADPDHTIAPRPGELTPLRAILALSIPGALTHLLDAVELGTVSWVLKGLPDATTSIASWTVYRQMLMLACMPAAGTSVAVVPYVALLLPRGDATRILRELRQTVGAVIAVGLVFTVVMGWLFAEPLAGFFVHASGDGESLPVSDLTLQSLRLLPLGALAMVPFYILRPVLEAAGQPRLGIRLSVLRYLAFSMPLLVAGSFAAPHLGLSGLHGMIGGMTIGTGLAAVTALFMVRGVLRNHGGTN